MEEGVPLQTATGGNKEEGRGKETRKERGLEREMKKSKKAKISAVD